MFVTKVHALIAFTMLIDAVLGTTREEYIAEKLKVAPGKDSKCHDLISYPACNSESSQLESDWTLSGWFYHSLYKSCRPVYSSSIICKENQDIPKTREECENVCGDPCTLSSGFEGVCTMDTFCLVNRGIERMSCGSFRVNCCPKLSDKNFLNSNFADDDHVKQLSQIVVTRNSSGTFYILVFPRNKT